MYNNMQMHAHRGSARVHAKRIARELWDGNPPLLTVQKEGEKVIPAPTR